MYSSIFVYTDRNPEGRCYSSNVVRIPCIQGRRKEKCHMGGIAEIYYKMTGFEHTFIIRLNLILWWTYVRIRSSYNKFLRFRVTLFFPFFVVMDRNGAQNMIKKIRKLDLLCFLIQSNRLQIILESILSFLTEHSHPNCSFKTTATYRFLVSPNTIRHVTQNVIESGRNYTFYATLFHGNVFPCTPPLSLSLKIFPSKSKIFLSYLEVL
jgi:hypothetical protein